MHDNFRSCSHDKHYAFTDPSLQFAHATVCDQIVPPPSCMRYSFNARTHMGCDGMRATFIVIVHVSIHAPPWGATSSSLISRLFERFNSRTHMGCDRSSPARSGLRDSFNSRTHMGCDLRIEERKAGSSSFNSRTHMGCDCHILKWLRFRWLSLTFREDIKWESP